MSDSRGRIKAGDADATTRPRTRPGIKQGNANGQLRAAAGPPARRRGDGRGARPGINPEGARADRPADAEPLARRRRMRRRRPVARRARRDAASRAGLRGRGRRAACEPAAVPTLRFALRIDSRAARAVRSVLLDVQIRIAATPARATTRREQERLVELFGEPERWGRHAAHAAVDAAPRWSCRRSPARRSSTSTCPAPTTSRCAAAKYLGALERRRGAARAPVQRHGVLRAAPAARCRRARIALGRGGRLPAAGARSGARRWTATSRAAPGCGWTATRFDRLAALQGARARCRAGSRARRACCEDAEAT